MKQAGAREGSGEIMESIAILCRNGFNKETLGGLEKPELEGPEFSQSHTPNGP